MTEEENLFLPIATHTTKADINEIAIETWEYNSGNSPCPCCGCITIPHQGNAMAFICPVCFWEIDLFIKSEDEPSDQNHGLTLNQGRKNFKTFGAVLPYLKEYCRNPNNWELPRKDE